jgi:hypothetical protein
MLPAVAGWQWWVSGHLSRSWDLVTLYYTNYLGFQVYNVSLRDLPLVMWHNLDGFLMGAGKLLTFDVPFGSKHLERVVAVAAIAGCVRLARRTHKLQYPMAGAGFTLALLVWHYTPDQRFVFPLYPLLLAGLWTELQNVWQALWISWKKPDTDYSSFFQTCFRITAPILHPGVRPMSGLPTMRRAMRTCSRTMTRSFTCMPATNPAACRSRPSSTITTIRRLSTNFFSGFPISRPSSGWATS